MQVSALIYLACTCGARPTDGAVPRASSNLLPALVHRLGRVCAASGNHARVRRKPAFIWGVLDPC